MSVTADWRLSKTYDSVGGTVAYEVLGDGPPVVLVHGTPSWSYLWRNVANELAERFTIYVCDLLGYGTSEKREGQDVSIGAQTRMLVELLELWELEQPCIAGHDFGGAITLRLMLLEGRRFSRVALCDAVAIAPWITPFSRHVQRHLEAFQTVPEHIHRQMIAAHLRTAIARDIADAELEPYLLPWLGPHRPGGLLPPSGAVRRALHPRDRAALRGDPYAHARALGRAGRLACPRVRPAAGRGDPRRTPRARGQRWSLPSRGSARTGVRSARFLLRE